MSGDPRRWRDDPALDDSPVGRELRAWLRSDPGIAPLSASTRQAVAGRIEVSLASGAGVAGELPDATHAAPANGGVAAPAAAPQLALLSAAKLACVVAIAIAAGTGAWLATSRVSPSAGVERQAQSPAPRATPPSQPSAEERAESAERGRLVPEPGAAPVPAVAAPSAVSEPTHGAHARPAARAPSAPGLRAPESSAAPDSAASATALREEVRLLRSAREQLALHPARAAELLGEYAARFPDGALIAEYAALAARLGPPGSRSEGKP